MIENGFVYAFEKSAERRAKEQVRIDKKTSKFYGICRKYDKAIDTLNKNEMTKTEYKFIVEYIEKVLKYPLSWYSNLQ